ncbi:MAG: chondroitinase-B domain-containing protein [Pseudomonadota bacterium]
MRQSELGKSMRRVLLAASLAFPGIASAADAITVGDVVIDPSTVCCLGFSVPVSGDDNDNAVATIEYRATGTTTWREGLPLLRVRPELTSQETPPSTYGLSRPVEQFAGSVLRLSPGASYDIRIRVTDPDGGDRDQVVVATTRSLPLDEPATPRFVAVSDSAELDAALGAAAPGDVIELAGGTYDSFTVSADGTAENPIIIRGASADAVTIDASGRTYGVTLSGEHIYLEHVTVTGSTWGARSSNTTGTVIRYSRFLNIDRGIFAQSGTNRHFYICDNRLEGDFDWPTVGSVTFDAEGIVVSGQGHTICHNTLSGFGDALGLGNQTSIENVAIDFFGNDVLWTGDDGLELDFSHRNVRAFDNRITNANMGVSLQPVWGGPVYVVRNVFLNLAASAYKLNNDPNGFYLYHNTSARTLGTGNWGDWAWTSLGYTQSGGYQAYAGNFEMKNNILIGLGGPARVTTDLIRAEIDYNGWSPDGPFRFADVPWTDFADLQATSPYEANGRILDGQTFAAPLSLPANYMTFWSDIEVRLGASSPAIDAALALPNINDGFEGAAPDLGAVEFGQALPAFGVRPEPDDVPPAKPTNVSVE